MAELDKEKVKKDMERLSGLLVEMCCCAETDIVISYSLKGSDKNAIYSSLRKEKLIPFLEHQIKCVKSTNTNPVSKILKNLFTA